MNRNIYTVILSGLFVCSSLFAMQRDTQEAPELCHSSELFPLEAHVQGQIDRQNEWVSMRNGISQGFRYFTYIAMSAVPIGLFTSATNEAGLRWCENPVHQDELAAVMTLGGVLLAMVSACLRECIQGRPLEDRTHRHLSMSIDEFRFRHFDRPNIEAFNTRFQARVKHLKEQYNLLDEHLEQLDNVDKVINHRWQKCKDK